MKSLTISRGAAVLLGMALSVSTTVQAEEPACSIGAQRSFTVPVSRPSPKVPAKGPTSPLQNPYNMRISIQGGGLHTVQVDTGSTGIVVSRASVPNDLWRDTQSNGVMSYSSDGLNLVGRYAHRAVTLGGAPDAPQGKTGPFPTTVPIDILITACACALNPQDGSTPAAPEAGLDDFNSCENLEGKSTVTHGKTVVFSSCKDSRGTSMMGVGFNRGSGPSTNNPFLQLEDVNAGTVHAGYVIGETTIQLGLNQTNTKGFRFAPLAPNPAFPAAKVPVREWLEPEASVRFDKTGDTLRASVLMDTGIDYMMLTIPEKERVAQFVSQKSCQSCVPQGTAMTLTLPATGEPALTYAFTLGKDVQAPRSVSWRGAEGSAHHINTGRYVMVTSDYAYDARCGQLGFSARK